MGYKTILKYVSLFLANVLLSTFGLYVITPKPPGQLLCVGKHLENIAFKYVYPHLSREHFTNTILAKILNRLVISIFISLERERIYCFWGFFFTLL